MHVFIRLINLDKEKNREQRKRYNNNCDNIEFSYFPSFPHSKSFVIRTYALLEALHIFAFVFFNYKFYLLYFFQ